MALGEHGGARGWLIGRLHEGMSCMFTMMNHMRLGVGLHSLGLAERSLQLARAHAHERLQGRDTGGRQRPIIEHADVRRMLLRMKALTQAARGLCYTAAATLDLAHSATDPNQQASAVRRADLLTPIVKAWCSDTGVEVASLGVQIHGGAGYIDDSEISQVYRDARIGPIFEGTNYIQAQDLLARKIIRDEGAALASLLEEFRRAARALPDDPGHALAPLRNGLLEGSARFLEAMTKLIQTSATNPDVIGATAWHVLRWLGTLSGAWQWSLLVESAQASEHSQAGERPQAGTLPQPQGRSKSNASLTYRSLIDTAAFYAAHILPSVKSDEAIVEAGADPVTQPSIAEL